MNDARAWLRQLPGIGPKSAGIILSFSLGMPAMAVDTHIYRVSQRLGFIGPKVNADKAHEILEAAMPPEDVYPFHAALITHGRPGVQSPAPPVWRLRRQLRLPVPRRKSDAAGGRRRRLRQHLSRHPPARRPGSRT